MQAKSPKKQEPVKNFRSRKFAAMAVITSTELAEQFISAWMLRYNSSRAVAVKRLRELGVSLTKLKKKEAAASHAEF